MRLVCVFEFAQSEPFGIPFVVLLRARLSSLFCTMEDSGDNLVLVARGVPRPRLPDYRSAQRWLHEIDSGLVVDDPHARCADDNGMFARNETTQEYVAMMRQWGYPFCKLCGREVPDCQTHFYAKQHLRRLLNHPFDQRRHWHPIPEPQVQQVQLTPGIDRQRQIDAHREATQAYRERAQVERPKRVINQPLSRNQRRAESHAQHDEQDRDRAVQEDNFDRASLSGNSSADKEWTLINSLNPSA